MAHGPVHCGVRDDTRLGARVESAEDQWEVAPGTQWVLCQQYC